MKYQAQWGPKGFLISPEKIVTFDGFSTSIEMIDDSENDTSGTPPTNTKGTKPQNINLSITYLRAAGVDPRAQFEEWTSLVGKAYPFYISGERFGPEYLQLKKIDLSGLNLSNDGTFLSCTVAVSFMEYTVVPQTSTVKKTTPKTTTTTTAVSPAERQKNAMQQKEQKLLEEKEKALQESDARKKALQEAHREEWANRGIGGGGGGYKAKDDHLINSI